METKNTEQFIRDAIERGMQYLKDNNLEHGWGDEVLDTKRGKALKERLDDKLDNHD